MPTPPTPPPQPTLPTELTDAIIDHLAQADGGGGDWRALAACARVSPRWRERAGFWLARGGVRLSLARRGRERASDGKGEGEEGDLEDFLQQFRTGPAGLAELVGALTLDGAAGGAKSGLSSGGAGYHYLSDADVRRVARGGLRNVRALTLKRVCVGSAESLRALYTGGGFGRLEELALEDVVIDTSISSQEGQPDRVEPPSAEHALTYTYPPLKAVRLRARAPADPGTRSAVDELRDDLRAPALAATVRSLKVDVSRGDMEGWAETLVALQGGLEELRVRVWPQPAGARTALYAAIGGCARLRRLALHFSSGIQLAHSESVVVCGSVADWLSSTSGAEEGGGRAGRVLFARGLEEFTLCVAYPVSTLGFRREAVLRVGRALGRERYPALRVVRVNVLDRGEGDESEEERETMRRDVEEGIAAEQSGRERGLGGAVVQVRVVGQGEQWTSECI
ncbi:hypothetical protein OH77DRAFT_1593301 [Trametes cingulata]|nr:hypothetical protein OH77DRAFT_1593301 [Trametes cingulata]